MASQKSAARGNGRSRSSSASRQGTAKNGARSATATPTTSTRTTGARPQAAKSKAGNGTASGRSASPARGRGTAQATPAPAAPTRPQSLLGRAWWPFRSMGVTRFITFLLSLYGLGASIYLTIAHYDSSVQLVCSDKGLVNCEEVTKSPESMLFGVIPVAVLGLAFYAFMAVINSPWGWRLKYPLVTWVRFGSVIVGVCFVLYLVYAELVEINAICLWCTSVHVATFLIFVILVFHAAFKPVQVTTKTGR